MAKSLVFAIAVLVATSVSSVSFGAALVLNPKIDTRRLPPKERYFTLDSMTIEEVQVQSPFGTDAMTIVPQGIGHDACAAAGFPFANIPEGGNAFDIPGTLDVVDVVVDKVINIGKKIWTIVQAGKPVANISTDVATAMPSGARCWMDLENWQRPQSKVFTASFKNGFGMNVVKLSYRVIWLPGGQVNGQGAYIGYAAMIPSDVSVAWGFNMDAKASVPTVFNMGTRENPIAGMQLSMIYRVNTAFQTVEQSQAYFIDGKGAFEVLQ